MKNCGHLGYGFECLVFCSLRRKATHVRRGDHLRMTRESRHRHLVGCPAHVERTARDQPLVQRSLERDFVDQFAARCIDEKGRRLHPFKGVCIEHVFCFRIRRGKADHIVGGGKKVFQTKLDQRRICNVCTRSGDHYSHTQGKRQLANIATDLPIADHADRHLRQFLAGKIGAIEIAPPFAATEALMPPRNKPGLSQDCAYGELGDGGRVPTWRIDDTNFSLARRRHVDVDRAASGDGDQLQFRQPFNHASGKRREMGDGDFSAIHMRHDLVRGPLIFL